MHGLDVALAGVSRGRDTQVLAVAESVGKLAFELAAVVGLPDQIAERDAAAVQMLLDARQRQRRPKRWVVRQVVVFAPESGDVVKVFGVGSDLLKQSPPRSDMRLSLILATALLHQAVHAPDAAQRAMADREVELAYHAASAEGGKSLAQLDQFGVGSRRSFVRLMVMGERLLDGRGRAVLLEAAQPLADGAYDGGEVFRFISRIRSK